MAIGVGFGTIVIIVILVIMMAFRVLREYQRAVVFMLGRFWKVKGPGFFLLIPVIQQMVRIDLRTVVMDVPPQDVITRDNVSVKVSAVLYFRVLDPARAIREVENYLFATSQLAQVTLWATHRHWVMRSGRPACCLSFYRSGTLKLSDCINGERT